MQKLPIMQELLIILDAFSSLIIFSIGIPNVAFTWNGRLSNFTESESYITIESFLTCFCENLWGSGSIPALNQSDFYVKIFFLRCSND